MPREVTVSKDIYKGQLKVAAAEYKAYLLVKEEAKAARKLLPRQDSEKADEKQKMMEAAISGEVMTKGSGKGAAGDASLQARPCSPDRRRAAAGRCGRELLATLPNESRGSARGTRGSRSAVLLRGSREKKRIGRRSNPRGAGIGLGFCSTAQNISHRSQLP